MRPQRCMFLVPVVALSACSTMYYGTMERLGVHKRQIMVDRVEAARDSQTEAKTQFLSAMEQFKSVVNVKGDDLEREYEKLRATLQKSESKAAAVRDRIRAVEDVSEALFREWRDEIKQYSSEALRKSSEEKYDATRTKYEQLIGAMKTAEARLEPVLVPLRDQVLFLKHNLNARAVAGLSDELVSVEADVETLVRDMEVAIAQADAFIASLQE